MHVWHMRLRLTRSGMQTMAAHVDEADVLIQGRRMHYLRAGSGPPLLLIHGLVGSLRNWRFNIDSLAEASTVYAVDLLNMGESDRDAGFDPTLEATADYLVAFMDALGLAQADVAGHSHGGAVSLALAARYPHRVHRLILFAPANPFCDLGRQLIRFYRHDVGGAFARMIPTLPRWTKATALRRMYGDPARVPADALSGYVDGLAVPGTVDHVLRIVRQWGSEMARLRCMLPALANVPALLIWGDRDRAVGLSSAKHLERLLLRSSLVILPGVGHIPFEEMPSACNRVMLEFLASPSASESPDRTISRARALSADRILTREGKAIASQPTSFVA